MMNAEVTAENRPACAPSQYIYTETPPMTHKYQCCVQILIIFLHEFLIIVFSFPPIMFIEFGAKLILT